MLEEKIAPMYVQFAEMGYTTLAYMRHQTSVVSPRSVEGSVERMVLSLNKTIFIPAVAALKTM
jgi:hypothetical protein